MRAPLQKDQNAQHQPQHRDRAPENVVEPVDRLTPAVVHLHHTENLDEQSDDTGGHKMHSEWGTISHATADALNAGRANGDRIVAVCTPSLRLLDAPAASRDQLGGREFRSALMEAAAEEGVTASVADRVNIAVQRRVDYGAFESRLEALIAAKLGDPWNGFSVEATFTSLPAAVQLLRDRALALYPNSEFSKEWRRAHPGSEPRPG